MPGPCTILSMEMGPQKDCRLRHPVYWHLGFHHPWRYFPVPALASSTGGVLVSGAFFFGWRLRHSGAGDGGLRFMGVAALRTATILSACTRPTRTGQHLRRVASHLHRSTPARRCLVPRRHTIQGAGETGRDGHWLTTMEKGEQGCVGFIQYLLELRWSGQRDWARRSFGSNADEQAGNRLADGMMRR
jgi:hypothetical protein